MTNSSTDHLPSDFKGAERHLAAVRLLMAGAADRAYDAGMHLREIYERRLYLLGGHPTFQAYLMAEGFSSATAYSNMRLFEVFERADLVFGVSKLRLLVQGKFADPRRVLQEGIPVDGETSKAVDEFTYREFAVWVKTQPAPRPAEPSPIALAIRDAITDLVGHPEPGNQEAA